MSLRLPVALALVLLAQPVPAQPTLFLEQLLPPTPTAHDQFGYAVAASGDRVVVGAPGEGFSALGGAFVFAREADETSWALEAQLVPASIEVAGEFFPAFGNAVALSGQYALVGAPYESELAVNSGAAYIFRHDVETGEWISFVKLKAPEPELEAEFGLAVSLSGGVAAIGAPREDAFGEDTGVVHLFEQNIDSGAWNFLSSIAPVGVAEHTGFGYAVAVAGDALAVGTLNRFAPTDPALVHVFERAEPLGPFLPVQTLAGDGEIDDRFGTALALNDSLLAIGAPFDGETDTGAVYVFERDEDGTWQRVVKLKPDSLAANDQFGASVALEGRTLLVGAPVADEGATSGGKAYVFVRDEGGAWALAGELLGGPVREGDRFGLAVALSDEHAFVSAPMFDEQAEDAGAVHVFGPAGTATDGASAPEAFALAEPFPNPFRTTATIAYTLAAPATVRLAAYDVLGREVAVLAAGAHAAGRHVVQWGAAGLPAGLYLLRLTAEDGSAAAVRKVLRVQ